MSQRIREYLDRRRPPTPCLVLDLDVVAARFAGLRAALPEARPYYAVKANPSAEVLRLLVELGSSFDVASPGEVALCLAAGAAPESISYGNTIKKRSDVEFAHEAGVRLFAVDCADDLAMVASAAPGASVCCRLAVPDEGSRTPFGGKFGCSVEVAVDLLGRAAGLGLRPAGVSFHTGSQQLDPAAWDRGIALAARVHRRAGPIGLLDLGGGFPTGYAEPVPPLADYARAIRASLCEHFGEGAPELAIEPGRAVVADAGVIRTEVVQVASRPDGRRWVYLDVGRYNGLAETENEAIAYEVVSVDAGGPAGPVVLAGPTCDGDDVLYQRTGYELPLALRAGDRLDILAAGAYTASYASVGFNGLPPLRTYCVR
jgi:ornithine decarboxylase